jgi:Transposase IS4
MLTNKQLRAQQKRETTTSEILKYIGIMVRATHCQYSNRRDFWNTVPNSLYEIAYFRGRINEFTTALTTEFNGKQKGRDNLLDSQRHSL